MIVDLHRNARAAVAAYRREPVLDTTSAIAQVVLRHLEEDKEGRVTAALNNRTFRPFRTTSLIFRLIRAADLAQSRHEVADAVRAEADAYRTAAAGARALAAFCSERVPMELGRALPKLAEWLTEQAAHYDQAPGRLQITQKTEVDSADRLLALRHFAHRLRSELKIARLPHDAIRWLVGAALDCTISEKEAAEGLRGAEMGIGTRKRRSKNPNHCKPLNRQHISRR